MSNTPKRKPGRKPAGKTAKGLANAKKPEGKAAKSPTVTAGARIKPYATGWEEGYLAELARTGKQVGSAEEVGVDYTTVYRRRQSDPDFEEQFKEAMKMALAGWEEEARRRAVDGTETITYGPKGEVKSIRREYSDTILLRMLGRADPTWRDKQEISHTGGVDVVMTRAERIARLEKARADAKRPLS